MESTSVAIIAVLIGLGSLGIGAVSGYFGRRLALVWSSALEPVVLAAIYL